MATFNANAFITMISQIANQMGLSIDQSQLLQLQTLTGGNVSQAVNLLTDIKNKQSVQAPTTSTTTTAPANVVTPVKTDSTPVSTTSQTTTTTSSYTVPLIVAGFGLLAGIGIVVLNHNENKNKKSKKRK